MKNFIEKICYGLILIIVVAVIANVSYSATTVRVPQGGTGLNSVDQHYLLLGATSTSGSLVTLQPGATSTILTSNGLTSAPSWQVFSGLQNIVEDTSPQLGGNLDVNGFNITSAAGLDISIGSGSGNDFTIDTNKFGVEGDTGNVGIGTATPGSGKLQVESADTASNYVGIQLNQSDPDNWTFQSSGNYGFNIQSSSVSSAISVLRISNGSGEIFKVDASGKTKTTDALEIPNGASPTVDAVGEIAIDTTYNQFLYYSTSSVRTIPYYSEKCFTLENATSTDDNIPIWSPHRPITVTHAICRTSTSTAAVVLSDGSTDMTSVSCSTSPTSQSGFSNNTWIANEKMEFDTTASTTIPWLNYCFTYTVDRQ